MEIEIIKGYWKDGGLESERSYLNNVPHGSQIRYHSNGYKWRKYCEFYGVKNGIWEEWWFTNGTRFFIQQEKNDIIHGPEIIFNY